MSPIATAAGKAEMYQWVLIKFMRKKNKTRQIWLVMSANGYINPAI